MNEIEQIIAGITDTLKNEGKAVPIDMLVYTKLMYQKIQESGSIFNGEVNRTGKILYEALNQQPGTISRFK